MSGHRFLLCLCCCVFIIYLCFYLSCVLFHLCIFMILFMYTYNIHMGTSKQLKVNSYRFVSLRQTLRNTKERTGTYRLKNVHRTLRNTRERTGTYRKSANLLQYKAIHYELFGRAHIYIYILWLCVTFLSFMLLFSFICFTLVSDHLGISYAMADGKYTLKIE